MKNIRNLAAACIAIVALSANAADPAPAQFSSFDLNAPDTNEVRGVRLAAIYGKSGDVTGIDFAFGLSDLDNMRGVSLPLWIGGNRIRNEMSGVALGLVNLHEGQDTGVNIGLLNLTNNVNGLNWGAVNISNGTTLADVSFANISKRATFQLALFNNTDELDGIQIGILNCAKNGFFPCFPLFNVPK